MDVYVLTEDATSGKEFFVRIIKPLFCNNIVNVKTSGGNSNLRNTFNKYVHEYPIKRLLLCYDQIFTSGYNDTQMENNIVKLNNDINYIRDKCKRLKIQLMEVDWICFEDMFICYRNLYRVISCHNKEFVNLIQSANDKECTRKRVDLYKIYFRKKGTIKKHTLENLIGKELSIHTKKIKNFHIDKNNEVFKIGVCWLDNKCSSVYNTKHCEKCVNKGRITFKRLWDDVYKHNKVMQDIVYKLRILSE